MDTQNPATTDLVIVVPARLPSKRFPRKLLFEIKGKPLILWTAERIASQVPEIPLFFAVESLEVEVLLQERGYKTVMTSPEHPSGTDRVAEANRLIGARYVVNVQADEPMVSASQIHTLAELIRGRADIATLARRFHTEEDFRDHDKVKVVLDRNRHALYFSRAPIPFAREHRGYVDVSELRHSPFYWHLGLYAYKADFLEVFSSLSAGELERIERLEQLRALENGYTIVVGETEEVAVGIDTTADVSVFEAILDECPGSEG